MTFRIARTPWMLAALAGCVVADAWPPSVALPPAPGSTAAGSLTGEVTDLTGSPVAGAFVTVTPSGVEARTATDGTFVVPRLLPGPIAVVVAAPGFATAQTEVFTLDPEATEDLDVVLEPAVPSPLDGRLTVAVTGPDGSPAVGAEVRAIGLAGVTSAVVGPDGEAVLDGLGAQEVEIRVDWAGVRVVPRRLEPVFVPASGGLQLAVGLGGRGEPTDHTIGSTICGFCHPAVAASFDQTGHRRTLGSVTGPLEHAFDLGAVVPLGSAHAELGRDLAGEPQVVIQDATGARDTWAVEGVIGSGRRGAVPYGVRDGRSFPLPVAWAAPDPDWPGLVDGGWTSGDRAPWLDADGVLLGTPAPSSSAEAACFPCHVTGTRVEVEPDGGVTLTGIASPSLPWDEAGVGCEACHGLGETHTSGPLADKPGSIVLPDALGPALGNDVCGRCHGAVSGDHALPFAWTEDHGLLRPGDLLADHVASAPVLWPSGAAAAPGAQLDELRGSAHGAGGWDALCVDCHDPHGSSHPADLRRPVDATCEGCHLGLTFGGDPTLAAQHGGHGEPSAAGCSGCHAPETAARVAWRPSTGAGDLASHALVAVPPADALAAFDAAGVEELPAGAFPPSACQACHTWSAALAGAAFPGPAGDPLLRATHAGQQAAYEGLWP